MSAYEGSKAQEADELKREMEKHNAPIPQKKRESPNEHGGLKMTTKPIDDMTNEERTKFFEEHLSPLIRYGYQSAIDELIEFIGINEIQPPLMDKLMDMMNNKKQVDWKKLQSEVNDKKLNP